MSSKSDVFESYRTRSTVTVDKYTVELSALVTAKCIKQIQCFIKTHQGTYSFFCAKALKNDPTEENKFELIEGIFKTPTGFVFKGKFNSTYDDQQDDQHWDQVACLTASLINLKFMHGIFFAKDNVIKGTADASLDIKQCEINRPLMVNYGINAAFCKPIRSPQRINSLFNGNLDKIQIKYNGECDFKLFDDIPLELNGDGKVALEMDGIELCEINLFFVLNVISLFDLVEQGLNLTNMNLTIILFELGLFSDYIQQNVSDCILRWITNDEIDRSVVDHTVLNTNKALTEFNPLPAAVNDHDHHCLQILAYLIQIFGASEVRCILKNTSLIKVMETDCALYIIAVFKVRFGHFKTGEEALRQLLKQKVNKVKLMHKISEMSNISVWCHLEVWMIGKWEDFIKIHHHVYSVLDEFQFTTLHMAAYAKNTEFLMNVLQSTKITEDQKQKLFLKKTNIDYQTVLDIVIQNNMIKLFIEMNQKFRLKMDKQNCMKQNFSIPSWAIFSYVH